MAEGRQQFGGLQVSFAGQSITLEQLFGDGDLSPGEMTKRLWAYIRDQGLLVRPAPAPAAATDR